MYKKDNHLYFLDFCPYDLMVGDGICDDGCNNQMYDFDQGDCCLSKVIDFQCQICHCQHEISPNSKDFSRLNICVEPMLGDGKCHDQCNNLDHFYDHFDCCYTKINDAVCSKCTCHLDGSKHENSGSCFTVSIGDGKCNDQCNSYQNSFDGGDCCLVNGNFEFCSICQCQDKFNDWKVSDTLGCFLDFVGDGRCHDNCNILQMDFDKGTFINHFQLDLRLQVHSRAIFEPLLFQFGSKIQLKCS